MRCTAAPERHFIIVFGEVAPDFPALPFSIASRPP
jgi:hypothetical protein